MKQHDPPADTPDMIRVEHHATGRTLTTPIGDLPGALMLAWFPDADLDMLVALDELALAVEAGSLRQHRMQMELGLYCEPV